MMASTLSPMTQAPMQAAMQGPAPASLTAANPAAWTIPVAPAVTSIPAAMPMQAPTATQAPAPAANTAAMGTAAAAVAATQPPMDAAAVRARRAAARRAAMWGTPAATPAATTAAAPGPLQREPDATSLPPQGTTQWPSFMQGERPAGNPAISDLEKFFQRSVETGYFQAHPLDQMFTGFDLKLDELTLNNNYMRLIFGGKPDPERDNIHLAYNHTLRQMAESPVDHDSLLANMNPLAFVPGAEATKDSLLQTFAEQRRFYKGAIDTDAERFLKTRPTHRMILTTTYGKKITESGTSVRHNNVRGQNDLIYRGANLDQFRPVENLSSKTYAPDGKGGEVPLSYENVHGLDPRAVKITDEPRFDVREPVPMQYNFNDVGSYPGNEIDRYTGPDPSSGAPGFAALFRQVKPRV